MHTVVDVIYRLRRGQSVRAIHRDLKHSRTTLHHYRDLARRHGFLDPTTPLPDPAEVLAALGPELAPPRNNHSTLEPYREVILASRETGTEMMALYLRLVRHHGYTGSYSSVRRFVHHLEPRLPDVVVRLETAPGAQAQVDFGSVGKLLDPATGQRRLTYCFVMTLSYSRHQYLEFVCDQRIETWIGCHRRAFAWFGGVPEELVIDNLKAAVLQASLEEPLLCEPYRQLARHYGCLLHPCRPHTPEHKGKAESGVHYVQRNFLAVEQPADLVAANQRAPHWVREVAGLRIHGTTRRPPLACFLQEEQAALLPLPPEPFLLREVRPVKVHRDCHVQLAHSYYSAPFRYVGQRLEAYLYEHTVQLYDGSTLLVTHPRAKQPGSRVTRLEHYPPEQSRYLRYTREYCQEQAGRIGPSCRQVVESLLAERPLDHLRSVQGLLGLGERYSEARLEAACARVLHYGAGSYRRIKSVLEAGLDAVPLALGPLQPPLHLYEYARPASDFFGEETPC
jgi:transposase